MNRCALNLRFPYTNIEGFISLKQIVLSLMAGAIKGRTICIALYLF